MEKPYDIQERAFLYACEIVDFCRPLVTGHPLVRELGRQLLKAGAYADKRVTPSATPLIQEASELVSILTAIKKNSESDDARG